MEIPDCLQKNIRDGLKHAILGIGSTLRSDDAAGMYFIERIRDLVERDDVLFIAGSTAPENFTGVIRNFAPDKLFIVDAAHMGLLPGETKMVPAGDIGGVTFSTHMLPLSVMLKYLESEADCDVLFIGIQPKSTDLGFGMSDEVENGTKQLIADFYNAFQSAYPGQVFLPGPDQLPQTAKGGPDRDPVTRFDAADIGS
jgi:hydrogenase 3 maturation protease